MVSERIKKIIFNKLYKNLGHVEIIDYNNDVWFIDRENKFWFLELKKSGTLWWKYDFFNEFFSLFSLERDDFESIISDWVEEVLNRRVNTTVFLFWMRRLLVEEVLNCRVNTTLFNKSSNDFKVKEVLNHKVNMTISRIYEKNDGVDDVLNHKVLKTREYQLPKHFRVEEVLKHNVTKTGYMYGDEICPFDEILNNDVV